MNVMAVLEEMKGYGQGSKRNKMTELYSTLAGVYHEMYQHIFDYDKEFSFYDSILKKNNCSSVLEVGCGSGMLARRFLKSGYEYLGVDYSMRCSILQEMKLRWIYI